MGEGLALLSAACFAIYSILAKKGMAWGDKELGALITLVENNIFNLAVLLLNGQWGTFARLPWEAVLFFSGAGLFTSLIGRFLLFNSIERIGPSRAGTFKVATPVYTVLIGIFILGETLSGLDLWGILLTLAGLFFVSYQPVPKEQPGPGKPAASADIGMNNSGYTLSIGKQAFKANSAWGITFGLLSGLSFSTGNIFRKAGMNIMSAPVEGTAIGSLIALLVSGLFLGFKGKLNRAELARILPGMKYFVAGGVFNSVALFSFFFSLRLIPVSVANVVVSVEPLFLVAFSFLWLRRQEDINLRLLAGALCSFVGVTLIVW